MSHYDYEQSKEIAMNDYSFYSLIMAAMRQADTQNAAILRNGFPDAWEELEIRYHSPGGKFEGESPNVETIECENCGDVHRTYDRQMKSCCPDCGVAINPL